MKKRISVMLMILLCISGCMTVQNNEIKEADPEIEVVQTPFPEISWGTLGESEEVDDSYFDDAVMIGDSRMQGLSDFALLPDSTVLAARSLSVRDLGVKKVIEYEGQKKTVMEALEGVECSKIYICFGFNELGYQYPEIFAQKYAEAIDQIRQIRPGVPIVVLNLFPVSRKHCEKQDPFENTERIMEYNELIEAMTQDRQTWFLDVCEAVSDEDGYLREEYTEDGTHLNIEGMEVWLQWLKKHALKGENK